MTMFRVKADGYFMGTFLKKGDEIDITDKQGKYAVLSGQLEYVYPPEPKAKKKAMASSPFFPSAGAPPPKKVVDNETGEFTFGRKIGGSLGGHVKK